MFGISPYNVTVGREKHLATLRNIYIVRSLTGDIDQRKVYHVIGVTLNFFNILLNIFRTDANNSVRHHR